MAAVNTNEPNPADDLLRSALQEADSTYQVKKQQAQAKSGHTLRLAPPPNQKVALKDALQEMEDARAAERRRQAELAKMSWIQRVLSSLRG